MSPNDSTQQPHRRYNPLLGDWVLVSPQRVQRPWQGRVENTTRVLLPEHDDQCYLCPGNARSNGQRNATYQHTFVFDNDFPALATERNSPIAADELLRAEPVAGTCRVLCFSPRHDLTLSDLSAEELARVVALWVEQTAELGARYPWVQIFENRGDLMGASNAHPHGQVWALDTQPSIASREDQQQRDYYQKNGSALLPDYVQRELELGERVVVATDHWVVLVPYWAAWPFETLVLPRRHVAQLPQLNTAEQKDLAIALGALLRAYDALFQCNFPYSMGWHGAPFDAADARHWLVHAHYYPPLLRSANVKKFMVGYELLAEVQRDITPEHAAQRLRDALSVAL